MLLKEKMKKMNDEKLSYLLFGEKKNSQALIRIPQDNHSSQQANYYWIDLKKCLGKGGYGTVYSARQVDSKGNLKDYFVAKLFKFFMYEKGKTNKGIILEVNKEIEAICNTEYKNTKNYYPKIEKPVVLPQDGMLLLSPYLGLPFDNKDVQNELKKFGFKEWIGLICELADFVNRMHHETPSKALPYIHGDIKMDNIVFDLDELKLNKSSTKPKIRLLDFGLSKTDKKIINHHSQVIGACGANVFFMPPECCKPEEAIGLKTDIYSLGLVFLEFLGVKNVIQKLGKAVNDKSRTLYCACRNFRNEGTKLTDDQIKERYSIPFSYEGFLKDKKLPDVGFPLKDYLKLFIGRMLDNNYNKRPGSDEVLHFFMNIKQILILYSLDEKNLDPKEKSKRLIVYGAKLALMAHGFWEKPVHKNENDNKNSNDAGNNLDVEKFDFEKNDAINQCIIYLLSKEGLVNTTKLNYLFSLQDIKWDEDGKNNLLKLEKITCKLSEYQISNKIILSYLNSVYLNKFDNQGKVDLLMLLEDGDFEHFKALLLMNMMNGLDNYIEKKKRLPPNKFSRTFFGFTNQEKLNAAQLLKNTIKQGSYSSFFDSENNNLRAALQQGTLGKITKYLCKYIDCRSEKMFQ